MEYAYAIGRSEISEFHAGGNEYLVRGEAKVI